jgi:hypothetical protein
MSSGRARKYGYKIEGVSRRLPIERAQTPAKIRALQGQSFGAASAGRRLSADQIAAIEGQMRQEGKL